MWLLRLSFDLSVTAVVLCFDFQGDDICGWDMVCNLYCYWRSCLCIRAYRYSCAYSMKIKVPHFRLGSLLCCWSLEELSLAQLVEGVDVRLDQPFSNPHRGDFNLLIFLFYSSVGYYLLGCLVSPYWGGGDSDSHCPLNAFLLLLTLTFVMEWNGQSFLPYNTRLSFGISCGAIASIWYMGPS